MHNHKNDYSSYYKPYIIYESDNHVIYETKCSNNKYRYKNKNKNIDQPIWYEYFKFLELLNDTKSTLKFRAILYNNFIPNPKYGEYIITYTDKKRPKYDLVNFISSSTGTK